MMITWQKRIQHIDRRVKPRELRGTGVVGRLRQLRRVERSGRPPRYVSADIVLTRMRLRFSPGADSPEAAAQLARLDWRERNERLTWRAREKRRRIAAARLPIKPINLAQRRREWLAKAEKAQHTRGPLGG